MGFGVDGVRDEIGRVDGRGLCMVQRGNGPLFTSRGKTRRTPIDTMTPKPIGSGSSRRFSSVSMVNTS